MFCLACGREGDRSSIQTVSGVTEVSLPHLARTVRARSLLPVILCTAALLALCVAPADARAGALTWSLKYTGPTPYGVSMDGISCPSVSLCVVVDSAGDLITSQDPSGGAGAWHLVSGVGTNTGVSCPSVSLCVALASDGVMVSTNPTGGAGAWRDVAMATSPAPWAASVSCPAASLCVVGDSSGNVVTSTNPTGDASGWTATHISVGSGNENMQVSCASASLCVAVDGAGYVFTSTDPTGGQGAWATTNLGQGNPISAVSCPTASLCLGVGGAYGTVTWTTNPTGGAAAWHSVTVPGLATMNSVTCASSSLCAVGGTSSLASSTSPTGGGTSWKTKNTCGSEACDDTIVSLSCPSASLCIAGDTYQELWSGTSAGSSGPGGTGGTQKALCRVPKVIGKKLRAARRTIVMANCTVGKVKRKHSSHRNKGRVMSQSPRAGASRPAGTKVSLILGR